MSSIETALQLVLSLYKGETDRSGLPEIMHLIRVAAAIAPSHPAYRQMVCAALLHDSVEDGKLTLDVIAAEFGEPVSKLIETLTRKEGEEYKAYVDSTKHHPQARQIKIADARDNLLRCIASGNSALGKRYIDALHILDA